MTYRRAWIRARQDALTAAGQASPLARLPYDLRHAYLSTWLNGGVDPTGYQRISGVIGKFPAGAQRDHLRERCLALRPAALLGGW